MVLRSIELESSLVRFTAEVSDDGDPEKQLHLVVTEVQFLDHEDCEEATDEADCAYRAWSDPLRLHGL